MSPTAKTSLVAPDALARVPTWALGAAGIALTALAGCRAGVAVLAWIAPIPLALAATRLRGWGGRLQLLLVTVTAVLLQTVKIVTPPLPLIVAFLYAVPIGAVLFAVLALWDELRRRAGPVWGLYAFAGLTVLGDYLLFGLSPIGAWGTTSNSQVDNLPLLQLASLGGLGLIGWVMAWPAGAVATALLHPEVPSVRRHLWAAMLVALGVHAWGALRLDRLELGPTIRVAGVFTRLGLTEALKDPSALPANTDQLFARTELAADRQAELVVWNEAAALVTPDEEAGFRARAAELARRRGIDLVLAYGVLLGKDPLLIDNKYEWLGKSGESLEVYRKHVPVPGEPSLRGDEPIRVLDRPWGRAAGAICYDYDFPRLARQHAQGGAGLIALPSSDWRGIDPYHSQMARVRAIEGGMSVVRSVRDSTSMAFDPYGRLRGSLSPWEENERVMLATVPTRQVPTLYTRLGDWPVLGALGVVLASLGMALGAGRLPVRRREAEVPNGTTVP